MIEEVADDERLEPVPRWLGPVFLAIAVVTVAWIGVLWSTLPRRDVSEHYRLAWVGFDGFLALILARTGWLAWLGKDHVQIPAAISAALLVVDAWFDVVTASGRANLIESAALAVVVELPLAAACLWVSRHAEKVRRARLAVARASEPKRPGGRLRT